VKFKEKLNETGKFRGLAQNSAFHGKLFSGECRILSQAAEFACFIFEPSCRICLFHLISIFSLNFMDSLVASDKGTKTAYFGLV